jgi:UDP-N-acetylmuramyl pentapeptide phosphotransferase/UDP-N-acetylglucosamine-1-phosphate transferase
VTLGWAAIPVTLFWITGMTNLYNFMDGIDGIAAGAGTIYATGVAVAAFSFGHSTEGTIAAAVMGSCLGFLWFNFPPARVFMGDVGSLLLGFVFSVLAICLSQTSTRPIPLAFFVIAYSSFIFDATYTLVQRIWRREKLWNAHRGHLYQRLVIAGWSHRRVTLLYVTLSAASLALGLAYLVSSRLLGTTLVGVQLLACAGLVLFVKRIEKLAKRSGSVQGPAQG